MTSLMMYILIVSAFLFSSAFCKDINPPQGNTEFYKAHGVGTVSYVCKDSKFVFINAKGSLQDQFDQSIKVGGFEYTTSTAVTFGVGGNSTSILTNETASSPSSNPDSLPNTLFSVSGRTGPGNLEGATFVQQTDTLSGISSRTTCVDGESDNVQFRATYRFFMKMPDSRNRIRPLNSSVFLMSTQCVGTFNYVCKNQLWETGDVKGDLFPIGNSNTKIGTYSISPTADANGGRHVFTINSSSVTFKSNTTELTRTPNIIPEELYSATSTTAGILEKVKFGQRINTSGGNQPSTSCTEGQVSIPFKAQYVFYV